MKKQAGGGSPEEIMFYIIPLILSMVTTSFIFECDIKFLDTKSDDFDEGCYNNIFIPFLSIASIYRVTSLIGKIMNNEFELSDVPFAFSNIAFDFASDFTTSGIHNDNKKILYKLPKDDSENSVMFNDHALCTVS